MIRIIRDYDDQDQNHGEDHIALADTSFLRNIAKGTVSSQARQELNPSQVTAYLRIKREPPEVEDTCISGDSSQDLHKQIIRNGS